MPTSIERSQLLNKSVNYVVTAQTRMKGTKDKWSFNITSGKLARYAEKSGFHIIAACNYESDHESLFAIPYDYFDLNIRPVAREYDDGRFMFQIDATTLEINWVSKGAFPKVRTDGTPWLVK